MAETTPGGVLRGRLLLHQPALHGELGAAVDDLSMVGAFVSGEGEEGRKEGREEGSGEETGRGGAFTFHRLCLLGGRLFAACNRPKTEGTLFASFEPGIWAGGGGDWR